MTSYLWPYMDTIRVVLMNSLNFIYVAICFNYCMFISRKCLNAISSVNPPPPPPNPPQKKKKKQQQQQQQQQPNLLKERIKVFETIF